MTSQTIITCCSAALSGPHGTNGRVLLNIHCEADPRELSWELPLNIYCEADPSVFFFLSDSDAVLREETRVFPRMKKSWVKV